ncbi:UNVERIFIED_CONTAM: hypothetical protein GTU68_006352 [Idotea baltica]|nr:hypothetical protein [Idotea baltica]
MASGKSTIGRILSEKLQISFIDLDDFIQEKENMTISELFKMKGEIYFRKKETECLEELLKNDEEFVLALGGGTPCYGKNMDIINSFGTSFYLKSSLQNSFSKLSKPKRKKKRPLIASIPNENLKEFIAKHLFERAPYYELATNYVLIDGKSKNDIANEVESKLK